MAQALRNIEPTQLYNLGKYGVILDLDPHMIPPEAWSNANNVMFTERGVERAKGHEQVFGTMSVTPEFIINVPGVGASFWIYTSLVAAYVFEGGVHTKITRQTASVDVPYNTVNGRSWNGTVFGGIPIINNGIDTPQFWGALAPSTKLDNLPAFTGPVGALLARKLVSFGEYLVAINVTENSVPQEHSVYWSHKAGVGTLPSSWDYSDPEVDAGRLFLTDSHGGEILDAGLLGDELIIYKEASTHALRFVGGGTIFAPRLILDGSGIFAPRCFCSFDKGTKHFVVTANDIIIHSGTKETKSVAVDRVQKAIFAEIDSTNYQNSFAFENKITNECWFCYPTQGNTYPNKAARWNYQYNTWTFRDFDGVATDHGTVTESEGVWDSDSGAWDDDSEPWSIESRSQQVIVNRVKAFKLESGYMFDTATPVAFVERTGLAIDGKDRFNNLRASLTSRKLLSRIWPKVIGTGQLPFQAGKQEILEGEVTYQTAQVFDPTTQRFLDSTAEPVNGLLLALRYETQHNDPWVLEGHDLYIEKLGGL
jgi:hypothetical protein